MRLDFAGVSSATERAHKGLSSMVSWLGAAMQVYRERRAMRALSDEILKDLGLSRADVEREAGRSFFDIEGRRDH